MESAGEAQAQAASRQAADDGARKRREQTRRDRIDCSFGIEPLQADPL
jgi:hypothetical protein